MFIAPEKIKRAQVLRNCGTPWVRTAATLGLSEYTLRCAMERGFRERMRKNRERTRTKPPTCQRHPRMIDENGKPFGQAAIGGRMESISIPQSVEEQRHRLLNFYHTNLTCALLGDPPIWRSALGKRQAGL